MTPWVPLQYNNTFIPELDCGSANYRVLEPPTCGENSHEGRESLLAGVPSAPAMVLGAINQVDIIIDKHSHWGQAPSLRVRVHTLHDQHAVVGARTSVGLPLRHGLA